MTDEPAPPAPRDARTGRRRTARSPRPERATRTTETYRHLRNPFPTATVLSDDEVAHLHETALAYLQRSGIRVLLPEARQVFAAAGARVDDDHLVRLDVELTRSLLATAPSAFSITCRNPERSVEIGGDSLMLFPAAGPPYVSDHERGRRAGTMADLDDFVRLTQRSEVLHSTTPTVEPQDVPMAVSPPAHDAVGARRSATRCRSSTPAVAAWWPTRSSSCGSSTASTSRPSTQRPYCWTNINTNSPRQLDVPMSMGIIDFAACRPGDDHDAVHAVGGDGAGVARRRAAAAAHRGRRRDRARPGRAARRAGGVRRVHLQRRHEVGRPGVRHAGDGPRPRSRAGSWPATSVCRGARRARAPRTPPTPRPATRR